jgi:phosphodiesterase/alkaline phosphatase D-like protein
MLRRVLFLVAVLLCAVSVVAQENDNDPDNSVLWLWSGAPTDTSIAFRVRTSGASNTVQVIVSTDTTFARLAGNPSNVGSTNTANFFISALAVAGLTPNTAYYYAAVIDGKRDLTLTGRFRTLVPPLTPFNFKFAFASCAKTGANSPAFARVIQEDPLFLMHTGDFHYSDICGVCGGGVTYKALRNTSCVEYPLGACGYRPLPGFEERCAPCENANQRGCLGRCNYDQFVNADLPIIIDRYELALLAATQGPVYRSMPTVYTWDDHDFGPNDSWRENPVGTAARLAYDIVAPHFPLAEPGPNPNSIHHSFTVGRVRIIMLDTRSQRDSSPEPYSPSTPYGFHPGDPLDPWNPNKTMLGKSQKAWFKNELSTSARTHGLVIVVSSMPWLGDMVEPGKLGDMWATYAFERRELADYIQSVPGLSDKIVMINGDAHMIAMDDGTANTYASNKAKGFPVIVSAAFSSQGQTKGMIPYSQGRKCTQHAHLPSLTNYTTCDAEGMVYNGMYPGQDQFSVFSVQDDGVNLRWGAQGKDAKGNEIVSMYSTGFVLPNGQTVPPPPGDLSLTAIIVISVLNFLILILVILCIIFLVMYCTKKGPTDPQQIQMNSRLNADA